VWHDGLLHKLLLFNYPVYLVKLIQSYLKDRSAYVSLNLVSSSHFDVISGVPQGSLIAPHLFNIFINDVPIPDRGHLSLFADDTAFYVEVPWKNLKSVKKLLIRSVSSLQAFFHDWKIHLNETKTEFSILTKSTKMLRKMQQDSINFNGTIFSWKDKFKYLGVVLDSKLTFKEHIDYCLSKAKAATFSSLYCLLKRNSPTSLDSKIRIYKSYLRPILTYACPVFANAAKCHKNKLQFYQNKILRMILNVKWDDFLSTSEIHSSLNIPTIHEFMDKLTNNFYSKTSGHPNDLFSCLGNYDYDSLTFPVKHKLPKILS
jgi:hypothetical protein